MNIDYLDSVAPSTATQFQVEDTVGVEYGPVILRMLLGSVYRTSLNSLKGSVSLTQTLRN
jgi:hypothetical protein